MASLLKNRTYLLFQFYSVASPQVEWNKWTAGLAARRPGQIGTGRYESALEEFSAAIRLDPSDAHAYANCGTVCMSHFRDMEKACADWKRACDLGQCGDYENAEGIRKQDSLLLNTGGPRQLFNGRKDRGGFRQ